MRFKFSLGLFFACLIAIGWSFAAVAADLVVQDVPPPVPTGEEVSAWLVAVGGLKGASALGIALAVTQGLLLAARATIGDFLGKYKLLAVYLLTMITTVLAQRATGVEWGGALINGNTLATIQVFGNQVFKQFFQKPQEHAVLAKNN